MPACYIAAAEYDPLRDEGEHYAARLAQAGVAVHCERLPGMVHACLHLLGTAPASRVVLSRTAARVATAI